MSKEKLSKVEIVDINMPFWSIVKFMVKVAIASIPAIFILTFIAVFLKALLIAMIAPMS